MSAETYDDSLQALRDIRDIMQRSAKFISLSGWSGVWAGCTALAGSLVAYNWLNDLPVGYHRTTDAAAGFQVSDEYTGIAARFILLAIVVLVIALAGGFYFTWRKARRQNGTLWNSASRRMIAETSIPLIAGGIFVLNFIFMHHGVYIAATCLTFYGLALINGSKYTLSDIKYLGLCEVALGCISLFMPGYGLLFWAIGFGVLHILYGIFMWNKYEKNTTGTAA